MDAPFSWPGLVKVSDAAKKIGCSDLVLRNTCKKMNIDMIKKPTSIRSIQNGIEYVSTYHIQYISEIDEKRVAEKLEPKYKNMYETPHKMHYACELQVIVPDFLLKRARQVCEFFSAQEIKIKLDCTWPMARAIAEKLSQQQEGVTQ